MAKLTNPRHEKVAQARALGKTLEECAKAAGYAEHASSISAILSIPKVSERVGELQDEALKVTVISLEGLYLELQRCATAKMSKFFVKDELGYPRANFKNVTAEEADCLEELTVEAESANNGHRTPTVKFKLPNKVKALTELIKLKLAMEERELARQALEANTIDGTVQDDEEDHMAFLAERYNLKSLEQRNGVHSTANSKAIAHTHQTDEHRKWAEEMGQRFSRKREELKQNDALGTSNGMANGKPNGNGSGSSS